MGQRKGQNLDINKACREMFAAHRVTALGEKFHVLAAQEYSCLFTWDNAYHAPALRHPDSPLA